MWQIAAQVHRVIKDERGDEWQSSRQVPTFYLSRHLSPTRQDAERDARRIVDPYDVLEITVDVWATDGNVAWL